MLSACAWSRTPSASRVRTNTITSVAIDPATWTKSARASRIARAGADLTGVSSSSRTGTTRPTSASQSTDASANQGRKNAAGTKARVPTASAATQRQSGARFPAARTQAAAYATVKNGADATRTTIRPVSDASVASWSATASGSPSGSESQNRRP